MDESIYSVGIDVGTTTTQVIFSRLFLERTGGFAAIPTIKVAKKDVVYESPIYFTPLVSPDIVDAARLREIVAEEYRRSAIDSKDVSTGAVIITGETARKENARDVARELSEFAGDFVVCTAGPDYEAVLAGWGSGAGELSKTLTGNIVNFDIGGGTTNAAVFQNGEVLDAYAADIGGRLVKAGPDGVITYVSEKIRFLAESLGLGSVMPGCPADTDELIRLTDRMAGMLLELAGEAHLGHDTRRLFIGHTASAVQIDRVMFSGGVAEYVYREPQGSAQENLLRYGDIGPLLGASIRGVLPKMSAKLLNPQEKIRATVVGAGSYSTGISGSTVTVDEALLPLKNIPAVVVSCAQGTAGLGGKIASQARLHGGGPVAVAVHGIHRPAYALIKEIAAEIAKGLRDKGTPVIVLTECDCAKALGLVLKSEMGSRRPVVCLDKIRVDEGCFVDIGRPVCGVVPVVVKTLTFGS